MSGGTRFSVVIGFKDWGIERLDLTLKYLSPQVSSCGGELILSDYGSKDRNAVEQVAVKHGIRYVYTATDGTWSRSRALNAGFAISTGQTLIATDADMLFAPGTISTIINRSELEPRSFHLLQCRDLPAEYRAEAIAEGDVDWRAIDMVSRFRPRYGMGGMIAFPRSAYLLVRGFDERMDTYGGEDIDFAQRLQRAGLAQSWIIEPNARMYHVWHPSSRAASESTAAGKARVNHNSEILISDKSYIRNIETWKHKPSDALPVATVVVCTRNRAEYLEDAVYSSLSQSVSDIEVIVVDDGSTDNTAELLAGISDPRLQVLRQQGRGIASARNLAAEYTTAKHTVIFDDDDIMLPHRIRDHFRALEGGDSGTYGAWIDFNKSDGHIKLNPGREYTSDIVHVIGGVYLHPTLMIETELIRSLRYDETFRSGSDFNLATKIVRTGARLRHMHSVAILRRLHTGQVTHTDGDYQRSSWATTRALSLLGVSKPQFDYIKKREDTSPPDLGLSKSDCAVLMETYGPTEFANRLMVISGQGSEADLTTASNLTNAKWSVRRPSGDLLSSQVEFTNPTWKNIYTFASSSNFNLPIQHGTNDTSSGSITEDFVAIGESIAKFVAPNVELPTDKVVHITVTSNKAKENSYGITLRGRKYTAEVHVDNFPSAALDSVHGPNAPIFASFYRLGSEQ